MKRAKADIGVVPIPQPVYPEDPPPFVAPRMGGPPPKLEQAQVWRVKEPELDGICAWLVPLLKEEWPRLSVDGVWLWLRATMNERTALLIRTKNVVGLFYHSSDVLEPWPIVTEKFVRCREKDQEGTCLLYQFAKTWASGIGARELRFDLDSDAAMIHVRPALQTMDTTVSTRTYYAAILKGSSGGQLVHTDRYT